MVHEQKEAALEALREEFAEFIEKLFPIEGLPIPKQQAFFRFEEGHMWMQQAIIHYDNNEAKITPSMTGMVEHELDNSRPQKEISNESSAIGPGPHSTEV